MSVTNDDQGPESIKLTRDDLAMIRTRMAGDRTLLAYLRTALAFCASGVGLLKFWAWAYAGFVAWPMILIGIVTFVYGLLDYIRIQRTYKVLRTV